jgi:hypothetical protein
MQEYHKIQTVYLRDPATSYKTLLEGQFALPEFAYLADNMWFFTEKVDGTNIRVMFDGDAIAFGGKTDNAQIPFPLERKLEGRFLPQIETFGSTFVDGICLYGEGYGEKIQGGGKYRQDQDFVLFDINISGWWLQRADVEGIAAMLGLDVVPIIGTGTLYDMVERAKAGFTSQWGSFMAEGIVARPTCELRSRGGGRIITKIKYKDFSR